MERDPRLDWMRALAIIGVVIIHTSTRYGEDGTTMMSAAVYLSTLVRPSIAIFLLIAGYLIDLEKFSGATLKRKLVRVGVPYLLFSALAILAQYRAGVGEQLTNNPTDVLMDLILGRAWGIYYFVFVIVSMYLMAYLLSRSAWLKDKLGAIVVILFLLNLAHQLWAKDVLSAGGWPQALWLDDYMMRSPLIWSVFFFAGLWIRRAEKEDRLLDRRAMVWALWLTVLIAQGVLYWGEITSVDGYHSWVGTLFSVATILILWRSWPPSPKVRALSEVSNYLFLSHIFVLQAIDTVAQKMSVALGFWFMPIATILCVALPWLALWLSRQAFGQKTRLILGA